MKNMKRYATVGIITVFILTVGSVAAFAASQYATPAEAVAGLSGREVQSVIDERAQTGKTYGAIANEAGVLDKFKAEMLEIKKDTLAARVAAGTMTQEQADAVIARIEENQASCDGTGTGRGQNGTGSGAGIGFGKGNGQGRGQNGSGLGAGRGQGRGQFGRGTGNGLRDGSCGR
ncbi:MAG: DUF2680 domain-containing protein [Clostridiaceae bacterium]|nr:DUF2680 domain-containing protein [Clostridiaceae bacterium]